MSHKATGIPGRSGFADVLTSIGSDTKDPRCIAAWVVAILSQVKDASPADWRKTQELFVGEVSQRYKELKEDVTRTVPHQSPSPGEHWRPYQLRQWIRISLSSILKGRSKRKIVFCLDEAASLFKQPPTAASNEPSTPFLAFRRFFSAIPKRAKLFGLVADIAGKLGMVFPQRMFDPSARAVDPTAKFFQPVWMVGIALREPDKLRRLMSEQEDVAAVSEDFIRELFKMGRPLWRALLDNDAKDAFLHLDDAVEFASQKLLDGVAPVTLLEEKVLTEAMATAIIGVVAGLEVAAWADLAQHMVSGHMRSVSHVSGDRERVFTGDVIEPILGEAAARILAEEEVLLGVLRMMGGVLKQALVVEGPRGEIVGRLLLVLAMHHCCRLRESGSHETYSHPVPLGSFLSVLCGRTVTAEGFIFFKRCMFLNRREIDGKLLLFCFVCGFAIIPQRNQAGFDVLLPWLVPGPDGNYQLLPDRMRAVPVQIRNRQAAAVKAEKLIACLSSWTLKVNEETGNPPQGQGGNPPQGRGGNPPQGQGSNPREVQGQGGGNPPQGRGGNPPQGQGSNPREVQGQGRGNPRCKDEAIPSKDEDEDVLVLTAGAWTGMIFFIVHPRRELQRRIHVQERVQFLTMNSSGNILTPAGLPTIPRSNGWKSRRKSRLECAACTFTSKGHQVDITEDSRVLVLRGVRFPFLKERVSEELEKMCHAFFKMEDELEVDKKRGELVHHNFVNCFKLRKGGNSKDEREPDLLLVKKPCSSSSI